MDISERAARLHAYLSARGPEDLETVLDAYGRARYDAGPVAYLLLADWWAAFDPEAALADTLTWPLYDKPLGVEAVARAWASPAFDGPRMNSIASRPTKVASERRARGGSWNSVTFSKISPPAG